MISIALFLNFSCDCFLRFLKILSKIFFQNNLTKYRNEKSWCVGFHHIFFKLDNPWRTYVPVLWIRSRIQIQLRSDPVFLGDLDPGKYRIWILYPQKGPCNSNLLVIKVSKIQFPNNFFSVILTVIGCLDLVRKCNEKIFTLLSIKNISKY